LSENEPETGRLPESGWDEKPKVLRRMYQVPECGVDVKLEAMVRTHGLAVTLGGVTARLVGRSDILPHTFRDA
jgi:hypothetical protein